MSEQEYLNTDAVVVEHYMTAELDAARMNLNTDAVVVERCFTKYIVNCFRI